MGVIRNPLQYCMYRMLAFASTSAGDGQLNNPQGVCVHGDRLYVADSRNHRIQVRALLHAHVPALGMNK